MKPKYSNKRLGNMARTLIKFRNKGDIKYKAFVMTMYARTGVQPSVVESMITKYAAYR